MKHMTKSEMIEQGYKYIATQNSASKLELWAKFSGYEDMVVYIYYNPQNDMAINYTRNCISFLELDMMTQLRDALREDFIRKDIKYDVSCIWSNEKIK